MKTIGTIMAIFVLVTVPAFAWDQPPIFVDGNVESNALLTHGDNFTGGLSFGTGNGEFTARGKKSAEGIAEVEIKLKGVDAANATSASSKNSARVNSLAAQLEGETGEVKISGAALQSNWATIDRGTVFITGGNTTDASFEGVNNGTLPFIIGDALTRGLTSLTVTDTSMQGITIGQANAKTNKGNDPVVNGSGFLSGRITLNEGNSSAVTNFDSTANFHGSGTEAATGKLRITNETVVKGIPGGVIVDTDTQSGAKAKGR